VTAVAALSLLVTAQPVLACGGFFCDAVTLSPIYQAGERILFSRDDTAVTMHIEIVYAGDPTSFGWVLPLAEIPTAPDGGELPLDELLQISSQTLFTTLQNTTDPTFARTNVSGGNLCASQSSGMGFGCGSNSAPMAGLASPSSGAAWESEREEPVTVLQEARVGPYDAQLIEATSGAELFEWLNEQGYFQDPKSEVLLDEYVEKGFKFLGIKLQTGQGSGDIKPIALTMSEQAPCVPLKLTSIAATPEMPILVWVLGQGRAIPKNFIHAVVNDQALTYPGAANYIDVVTAAVDTVEGRAWVTEYAQDALNFSQMFITDAGREFGSVQAAESVTNALNELSQLGFPWSNPDVEDVLRDTLTMPEGLTGYPDENCYWNSFGGDLLCDPNESHVTTEDEFYGALSYWFGVPAVAVHFAETVDLAMLKTRLYEDVIEVAIGLQDLFDREGATLTRFFTTLDPDEMTRDPIFSFNPDLPDIAPARTAELDLWYDSDCEPWGIMEYPDGSKYTFDCDEFSCFGGIIGPVPDAPALKWAQVIEETGLPRIFDPAQALQVDEALDQTTASSTTLPEQFSLDEILDPENPAESWPNPPIGHPDTPSGSSDDGGCSDTSSGRTDWVFPLMAILGLGLLRRRRLSC